MLEFLHIRKTNSAIFEYSPPQSKFKDGISSVPVVIRPSLHCEDHQIKLGYIRHTPFS